VPSRGSWATGVTVPASSTASTTPSLTTTARPRASRPRWAWGRASRSGAMPFASWTTTGTPDVRPAPASITGPSTRSPSRATRRPSVSTQPRPSAHTTPPSIRPATTCCALPPEMRKAPAAVPISGGRPPRSGRGVAVPGGTSSPDALLRKARAPVHERGPDADHLQPPRPARAGSRPGPRCGGQPPQGRAVRVRQRQHDRAVGGRDQVGHRGGEGEPHEQRPPRGTGHLPPGPRLPGAAPRSGPAPAAPVCRAPHRGSRTAAAATTSRTVPATSRAGALRVAGTVPPPVRCADGRAADDRSRRRIRWSRRPGRRVP
jgi:hypothetical protein